VTDHSHPLDPSSPHFKEDFTAFFQELRPRVRAIALHVAGPSADIDGITSESFARLFASLKDGTKIPEPSAYVRRIASNLSINYHRQAQKEATSIGNLPEAPTWSTVTRELDPETAAEFMELRTAIDTVLSEPLRQALLLRVVAKLTVGETAKAMGITPASVATNVLRAKRRLRQHLGDHSVHVMTEHLKGGEA
jgi:RNA polymerase sigma factor (sigma-70 family)